MAIQCGIISEKYPESNSIVQSLTLSQDPVVRVPYFAHPSRQPREITVRFSTVQTRPLRTETSDDQQR